MLARQCGILPFLILIGCTASDTAIHRAAPMTLRQDLIIGSDSTADYALTRVTDLVRDAEGNFLVVQPMDHSVWKYDAAGRFQTKIGRAGAGPGEFSMPAYLGFLESGDLWVCDSDMSRLTIFTDGRPDSTITPRAELAPLRFVPTRLLKDGSVFSKPSVYLNLVSSGLVTALPLLHLVGTRVDTIALLPITHSWWVAKNEKRPDAGEGYTPQPLADDPIFAVSPDGDEIVLVFRSAAGASDNSMTIKRLDHERQVLDSVVLKYATQPLIKDRISALVEERAQLYGGGDMFATVADAARSLAKSVYTPDHLPPATQVVAAVDGKIWIRREDTETPTVTWWVLDSETRLEWEFVAPRALTLFYATGRSAAGVILDELDVPHIASYTLVPQSRH